MYSVDPFLLYTSWEYSWETRVFVTGTSVVKNYVLAGRVNFMKVIIVGDHGWSGPVFSYIKNIPKRLGGVAM